MVRGDAAHDPDEFVNLDNFIDVTRIYVRAIIDYLGIADYLLLTGVLTAYRAGLVTSSELSPPSLVNTDESHGGQSRYTL
ncbi:MAG: hypothetical protein KJ065_09380 [Anaerolineae bacterium]|nr:hypothetical protein [Anaerolineae bacterium]